MKMSIFENMLKITAGIKRSSRTVRGRSCLIYALPYRVFVPETVKYFKLDLIIYNFIKLRRTVIMKTDKFSIGADISWYPQMLKSGFVFKNRYGAEQDLLVTLKEYNVNSIRLRTWVDPSDDRRSGHCSAAETLELAKLCRDQGFDIMLDLHYSDTWCDPGKQRKPK